MACKEAPLILHAFFMCCIVGVCGFNYPNLTRLNQPLISLTQQHPPPPPPFSVVTLQSHKLSNGLVIDCVRLLSNSSSSLLEEALSQFPKSGSGWRKLTRGARAQFEAEVPQSCSTHMGSMAVQRGDIFDNIPRRQHIMTPSDLTHSYAIYSSVTPGFFTGAVAALSINNPSVQAGEVSISQIWVIANREDDNNHSTLEAGWIVYPEAFGDNDPRLFTYWTNDDYQQTGCFNLLCSGFVQTDNTWTLGEKFPIGPSVPGNPNGQQYVLFAIAKDPSTGLWYLQLDTNVIGYWDPNILTNFQGNADELQYGGEVQLLQLGSSTQMGSGYFPRNGFPWAASYSFIRYLHETLDFNYFGPDELAGYDTNPNFYGLSDLKLDSDRRVDKFFFGGLGI